MRKAFVQPTLRGIKNMKMRGLTDADLDVEYTAEAPGAMLEYMCYLWLSLKPTLR